ncbi:MAG: glycosyltransferase family 39 protein [Thermodesulfobacteriota bacterium]
MLNLSDVIHRLRERREASPTEGPPVDPIVDQIPVLWAAAVLFLVFAWRILSSTWINLIPDECSYWTWSRRLDWSYFDNAPMVAYLIRLSTALWGESTPIAVRFVFLVLSFCTTYLVYRTSMLLFGSRPRAVLACAVLNVTPLAVLGGAAAVHDNALTFFWVLTMWACARWIRSENPQWFYVMGMTAGLAMLSKYTGMLLLPAIFLFLLRHKSYRGMLASNAPWIGALIAVLCALPILWWNYTHEWASLHHTLFIGAGSDRLVRRLTDGIGYHLAQFGLMSPLVYWAATAALVVSAVRSRVRPRVEETLLLCFSFPLLLFGLMAFRGHVEANWAVMGYPSAIVLAVEVIFSPRSEPHRLLDRPAQRRYMAWAGALALGMSALVVLHGRFGLLPAPLEARLGKADRIVWETRGWDELGRHVGHARRKGDVIAADSYQMCALLWFNVPGQPGVRYLAPWKRPAQFDVVEPSFDNLKGRDILFVSATPLEPTSAVKTTVYENFSSVQELRSFEVMYHGEPIRKIFLYRGRNFDPDSPRKLGPRSLLYRDY